MTYPEQNSSSEPSQKSKEPEQDRGEVVGITQSYEDALMELAMRDLDPMKNDGWGPPPSPDEDFLDK